MKFSQFLKLVVTVIFGHPTGSRVGCFGRRILGEQSLFANLRYLVFAMTISVDLLKAGEVGEDFSNSRLKTMLISGSALEFMWGVSSRGLSLRCLKC
jgi:hypothetical protein